MLFGVLQVVVDEISRRSNGSAIFRQLVDGSELEGTAVVGIVSVFSEENGTIAKVIGMYITTLSYQPGDSGLRF